jgi:transposase
LDSWVQTWLLIGASGVGGWLLNVVLALLGRKNSLDARTEARIKLLLEQYESTINALRTEVAELKQELRQLTVELTAARNRIGLEL